VGKRFNIGDSVVIREEIADEFDLAGRSGVIKRVDNNFDYDFDFEFDYLIKFEDGEEEYFDDGDLE